MKESEIMKKIVLLILIVALAFFVAVPPSMADDDGLLGTLHEYAPYSFWSSADVFLEDPLLDDAFAAIADAAADMGKSCYDAAAVKDFMADMFGADFAAVAISKKKTFTYYGADGAIEAMCRYRYKGKETVYWGEYPMEWHKYKRVFCVPRPGSWSKGRCHTPYKYVVTTQVHQHGDGMIHAHIRYGHTSFDDLITNPDYAMWWPTLALYGDTTAESLADDMIADPSEMAFMLPPCP
jgi:hypothetical protein